MPRHSADDILAAYRQHVRPGDTVSIGILADQADVLRSWFMAGVSTLERRRGVRIDRAGRHPNDVYLTVT
jgi:hypothetical protein